MILNTPRILSETDATVWRLASGAALLLAVMALWISPEFSLINLGISLSAGVVSLLLSPKMPRGMLALWVIVLTGFWLSPMAAMSPENQRLIFAAAVLTVSLVFQGHFVVYFSVLALGFGICLRDLGRDLKAIGFSELFRNDSVLFLELGLILGVSLFFARISHTRSENFGRSLRNASGELEKMRQRVSITQESLQLARERLLGRTLSEGESLIGSLDDGNEREGTGLSTATFDDVIATLRKTFAEFQVRGRQEEKILGPIRFVFFAPVGGYDEKALIAVDLDALVGGLEACLNLALESLPEIGARKREGVIRLSIRYGLRVIEVAVEDNGRGLASRNLQAETDLGSLKDLVVKWGGKFDRLARLGVGSRTSLELRILRERTKAYRATLRHQVVRPEGSIAPS